MLLYVSLLQRIKVLGANVTNFHSGMLVDDRTIQRICGVSQDTDVKNVRATYNNNLLSSFSRIPR